jgi:cardiolipin synthase
MSPLLSWITDHFFSVFTFFLTLIFISFVLRSKKPPGSTVAWLFFIAVIPYVGIPLYLLMTHRKIPFVKQKEKTIVTNAQLRDDQKLKLITTGEEAYEKIVDLITSAKHSILITTFIFANDSVGRSLIALLSKKAKQGVAVYLIIDAFGSNFLHRPPFKALRKNGGMIATFNPIFCSFLQSRNANTRNHRKLLVVDSHKAFVGGTNIAKEYIGPRPYPNRWIDLCLLIEGSAVKDIQTIFTNDWEYAKEEKLVLDNFEPDITSGVDNLQIIASGPDVHEDALYDTYISQIFTAQKRVWIATPYFVPDETLTKALELAARRGVDVHLLLPKKSNHVLADMARGSYLRQLLEAGCKVSLIPKMIHAKANIIDDTAIMGSANFDMRSLFLNYEIGTLSTSPNMTTALSQWFEGLVAQSEQSDFKVGYAKDLVEGVARVLGPLV